MGTLGHKGKILEKGEGRRRTGVHGNEEDLASGEALGDALPFHEGRRSAHVGRGLVNIGGLEKGRVVGEHSGEGLELAMGDVLKGRNQRSGGRGRGRGEEGGGGALGGDDGEDGGVRAVHGAAHGGGEVGNLVSAVGEDFGLAEVEDGVGGGCSGGGVGGAGPGVVVVVVRRGRGLLVGFGVVVGVALGLGALSVGLALPLPPFEAGVCGEGNPRSERERRGGEGAGEQVGRGEGT